MTRQPSPVEVAIRKARDYESSFRLAASLPDYFTAAGLETLKADLPVGEL